MGVFKWLRRERVTVTRHSLGSEPVPEEEHEQAAAQVGTIRTEKYKRDLAEFQARRSSGNKEIWTPEKKKCGRHSLPMSCTECTVDHDNTFNYEKKSGVKYKKKSHQRVRSANSEDRSDALPNIQFLFQNQVFMPGNIFEATSYSEPQKPRHMRRMFTSPEADFIVQRHLDFKDENPLEPPEFFKNNSLPYDVKNFLECSRSDDEIDGEKEGKEAKVSSQNSAKDEGCEEKLWEVMSELKNFDMWADEQLRLKSPSTTRSEDTKSDTSAYGLPIASACNLDISSDRDRTWTHGRWGVVPVQIKRLPGVTTKDLKMKLNTEINILRKCRHPNIILLMGVYPDVHNNVQMICERCVDTLYGILHCQGRILSAQTSVQYALDIANALVFLRMQGYLHTELNSTSVMITNQGSAKLADLSPCVKVVTKERRDKTYDVYSPEPQYVNIEDTREAGADCEPLISNPSDIYLATHAVAKPYKGYQNAENYRWHAPELFEPNEEGMVHPCPKSDVYSLCIMLWESCNAAIPWRTLTYDKLKELYTILNVGIRLPQDGTYPGSLLALLQDGLKIDRSERIDLAKLQDTLQNVKRNLEELEYILIPSRLSKNRPTFSAGALNWDTTSPTDSECLSPQNIEHKAVIHNDRESTSSDNPKSDSSPVYHTITKSRDPIYAIPEKCFIDDTQEKRKYDLLPEKDYSSACSTPIAKIKARIKDLTPGLHRSDSTEYCSILSPNRTNNFGFNDDNDNFDMEKPTAKLSRSFTPKSYKPLHIKVPEFNLDCVKTLLKDRNDGEKSSYNFDIQNYSLPTTPIARSNKLRKNAWLSGDISSTERSTKKEDLFKNSNSEDFIKPSVETPVSKNSSIANDESIHSEPTPKRDKTNTSFESVDNRQDSFSEPKRDTAQNSPELEGTVRERSSSWSFKSNPERNFVKYKIDDEVLASLSVKPLVAIHEKWIYEANRKTGRSMSLPEDNKSQNAVKPASHCVDTLQKSLPQLNVKKSPKPFRASASPGKNGGQCEQFYQAREAIAKSMHFASRDERPPWKKDAVTEALQETKMQPKTDQSTDTRSIEEFIKDLIRKEFQHLLNEASDDRGEDINKGINNIVENLKNGEEKKVPVKSFSRVKINGNNKPLLQITFSRNGENSLEVLDNCVNVTICDSPGSNNQSFEETLMPEDVQVHSLKRCQAFNAIQEARSTEDLYIDDDLSTQMQENFGRVKLIPLHGSLHEILCEKEDECCLIKVKQENGCDTVYFRCDNSDSESRDAIDSGTHPQDTVVFKRSISLVEERIQRVFPKDKKTPKKASKPTDTYVIKTRPKSEVFLQNINNETRVLSNSSPSLVMRDKNDEVEVNIESVMCYQDSSEEECLKCQADDDFEMLERKIEEDMANSTLSSLTCGCLEKISEENLSVINEEDK